MNRQALTGNLGTFCASVALTAAAAVAAPAMAAPGKPPVDLVPQAMGTQPAAPATAAPATTPGAARAAQAPAPVPVQAPVAVPTVVPQELPLPVPAVQVPWTHADALALLGVIQSVDSEGLLPADYLPGELKAAIAAGEGPALDEVANRAFTWLAEDLRDGRTPMTARLQWFAVDPDQDVMPTARLLQTALETHDVPGILASLAPTHADYAALKAALAATPRADAATRARIRANMDRWRWLARDLGTIYLITNVPEYQLRLTVRDRIIRTYRTVVGKPGRTATPQLAEKVQAVVFNPTWTVPQSIVVGEGLGARLSANPASALRQGYKVSKNPDGTTQVVQQPGDSNSLGRMKIDMPNPHAIYLHDTPAKALFNANARAFSHGCIRTERAVELGMTMAILGAGLTPEQAVQYNMSGKYTRVPMTQTFPVYITYFTMGRDITGKLRSFADIYERDAPVLASFAAPREVKTTQRASDEEIIKLDNPL